MTKTPPPIPPRLMKLIRQALGLAVADDMDRCGRVLEVIGNDYFDESGVELAVLAACDYLHHKTMQAMPGASAPDAFVFITPSDGDEPPRRMDLDEVNPFQLWAARVLMARANMDQAQFHALWHAHEDPDEFTRCVLALFSMVGHNARQLGKQDVPPLVRVPLSEIMPPR